MISIFRRLGAMPALPAVPEPDGYWTEPAPVAPAEPDPDMGEMAHLQAQLDQERRYRAQAEREAGAAVRRAGDAEAHVEELTARIMLAGPAPLAAELARARRTLLAQEDLLAGCRRDHGSNVRASALPGGVA